MSTQRHAAGTPASAGGQWKSNEHPDALGSLSDYTTDDEITAEDWDFAHSSVRQRLEQMGFSDEVVTDLVLLPEHVEETEQLARRRAEVLAPMRAFERGESHPTDAAFERMWEGDGGLAQPGFSRGDVERMIAHVDRRIRVAESMGDTMTAQKIAAEKEPWERAISTHGRSLGINQGIVFGSH